MRLTNFFLASLMMLAFSLPLSAQADFSNDPEMATIYFVRPSGVGAAINFKYFANEQYLGKCNHGKYLKVKLEPGAYLLWAKSENVSYVEANLEAGQSYLLNATPSMGGLKSGVKLKLVPQDGGKKTDKVIRALLKHKPVIFTEEELAAAAPEWEKLVERAMDRYNNKVKGVKEIPLLNEPFDLSNLNAGR